MIAISTSFERYSTTLGNLPTRSSNISNGARQRPLCLLDAVEPLQERAHFEISPCGFA